MRLRTHSSTTRNYKALPLRLMHLENRCVPSTTLGHVGNYPTTGSPTPSITTWGPFPPANPNAAVPAFTDVTVTPTSVLGQTPAITLTDFRAVSVDLTALKFILSDAPRETIGAAVQDSMTVTFPTPNGKSARFKVWEVSIMEPGLAAQFPDIKTYRGQGIDDPAATLAADITPHGFHSSVRSPNGSWYIDPYYQLSQSVYSVYDGTDLINIHGGGCGCEACAAAFIAPPMPDEPKAMPPGNNYAQRLSNGANLRSYRLAVAATGEYTTFHGGTVALGQAAIVTAVNRVNQVYENDLSIRLNLVSNNSSLVYTNASTDPYTNNVAATLVTENQTNVDAVITSANYDIGHVFGTGAGGFAPGLVGNDPIKAQGATGRPSPVGDAFFIDYVAHEIGHQFSANHTFNGTATANASQRTASTAYEPGSGTTIMAYAGIMGSDNIQAHSDAYFHLVSLDQITNYIIDNIPTVGTNQSTGNVVPSVNAGADFTIPANTPFLLSGTGSDPDSGGNLTFTWEQYDLGSAVALGTADNASSPLYRSVAPSVGGNSRSIPNLATVLAGQPGSNSEVAASTSRNLNFRLTVRDNKGAYNSDAALIKTVNTGSAFAITNFNTFAEVNAGTKQTVTWNVAGTTGNGINASQVFIDLSTDGGNTFSNTIAEFNDGSADFTLPTNVATSQARFRIRASSNIFYDITNANFTINDFTVTNANESGAGSLRQAILDANAVAGTQTITFSSVFNSPQQINLTTGEMPITNAVTINGPGSGLLVINGNNIGRHFNTATSPANAAITIRGLTLAVGKGTDGGSIYSEDESLTIEDSVLVNNSATEDGGAINVQTAGSLTLLRSSISGNIATDDGGGIYFNNGGSAYLLNSAIVNNKATTGTSGGLYFFGTAGSGSFSVVTSTIAGNTANVGGGGFGLFNFSGTLNVVNSTIIGNVSTNSLGGGILRASGSGTIALSSSIVSGNVAFDPDISSSGTVNANYSAFGSTSGFTLTGSKNIIGQNLKLRPLANNGGPTPTVAFEFDSPLRSAGLGNPFFPTDQRGYSRDSNGVDIGAFELQTTVTNASFGSGPGTLRAAIAESNRVVGTDTINFGSLFDTLQTITFVSSEADLTDAVTIIGKGESLTRISGNNNTRIFNTTAIPAGKTVTLRGLTLTAGSATTNGGAILAADENLVVEDSVISSSFAASEGGAIYIGAGGKLSLVRSSLTGNSATGVGGALRFVNGGNSEIIASSLVGNKSGSGGAIFLSGQGSSLTVLNSTLSGNSANFGGGVAVADFIGALTVRNTTITGNTAGNGGGGMDSFNGAPNIHVSTIISGNAAPVGPDISSNSTITVNFSAIGSAAGFTLTGANNLPFGTNLKLGALAQNGGPTLTHLPAADSPLVSAGSNPASLTTDQRGSGFARSASGGIDIGAVEAPPAPLSVLSITANDLLLTDADKGPSKFTLTVTYSEPMDQTSGPIVSFPVENPASSIVQINAAWISSTQYRTTYDVNDLNVNLSQIDVAVSGGKNLGGTTFGSTMSPNLFSIDTLNPVVSSITSTTKDGTYTLGQTVNIRLNFGETVNLTGNMNVTLDTGAVVTIVGPLSGTTINGTYNIASGHVSPDLNVTALALVGGGTLRDAAGNDAMIALPASNLANNAAIVINAGAGANLIVTNLLDSGTGSLRSVLAIANGTAGADTITFAGNVLGTITLTTGQLAISDPVTIVGPGPGLLTISGNNASRVFDTASAPATAAINFNGLTIANGKAGFGAGVQSLDEVVTLNNCAIINNVASVSGGAFYIGTGKLTLLNSTISNNTAAGSSGRGGGAMYASGSTLSIQNCTISNNKVTGAGNDGGGIYVNVTFPSPIVIRNSTISGNSTTGAGGGIGAAYSFNGSIQIQNSTITGNTASSGGGIDQGGYFANVQMASSIVFGNSAANGPDLRSSAAINATVSLIGSTAGAFNFTGDAFTNSKIGVNPLLGLLGNNGGPTLTHGLLAGSPAIDKGSNPAGLTTDQRGFNRVEGGGIDIGSFERPLASPVVISSVQVNNGAVQRSRVTNLVVTFDNAPTFAGSPSAAFQLKRQSDNAAVTLNAVAGGNTVTLTFTGGALDFGSLADGRYTLTALATQITNLDGDVNGSIGGDYILVGNPATAPKLYRLFGDENGDGTAAANDFIQFRLALGGSNPLFDFDGDGAVAASDFIQFRLRFGGSV